MSADQTGRIVCPSCGRSGPYKPELAGKRLKCKCGGTIQVAQANSPEADAEEPLRPEPIAPPPPQADDADDEYDIREPEDAEKRQVNRSPDVLTYRASPPVEPPPKKPDEGPTFFRPKTYSHDTGEEKSHFIKMVVAIVVIAAVVGGAIFGIKMMRGGSGPSGPQLGEDADIEAKMDNEFHEEIHAWYTEDSSRVLGPWTQSQALGFADRWQQEGAKQVIVFGARMSLVVVIELPDDPAKRKPIFDWQAQWHAQHMQRVWPDVGQKYLMIRLGV